MTPDDQKVNEVFLPPEGGEARGWVQTILSATNRLDCSLMSSKTAIQ